MIKLTLSPGNSIATVTNAWLQMYIHDSRSHLCRRRENASNVTLVGGATAPGLSDQRCQHGSVESGQERGDCLATYWFWSTKVGWGCGFQYKSKNMVNCCEVWSLHAPCNPAGQTVLEAQRANIPSWTPYLTMSLWEIEVLLHSRYALCVYIVVHVCIQSLSFSVLQPLINRNSQQKNIMLCKDLKHNDLVRLSLYLHTHTFCFSLSHTSSPSLPS